MTVRYLAASAVLLVAAAAEGHHSRSAFDIKTVVEMEGTVTEVAWTNPHYYLSINVPDESGSATAWTFEGHSIPGLVRNGWSRDTVTVGSRVRVAANPNKDADVRFALLNHVTRTDGKTYYSFKPTQEISAQPKPPLAPSTDFTGTWRLIRSLERNLVGFGPPTHWPLTSRGRAELESYDPEQDPSLACEPRGLPRMLAWPYAMTWIEGPSGIDIAIEHATDKRRLHATPGLADQDPIGMGRSTINERSDAALVVRTVGFDGKHWGLGTGISSGDRKALTERYELLDDGYRMQLTYSVEDPEYLTEPVEETLFYAKVHDYEFAAEPPCDVRTARRHLDYEAQSR